MLPTVLASLVSWVTMHTGTMGRKLGMHRSPLALAVALNTNQYQLKKLVTASPIKTRGFLANKLS